MKFQVGDLVLVKECKYKSRIRLPPRLHLRPHPQLHLHPHPHLDLDDYPHLINTYGVITEVINHSDAWQGDSNEDDNIYLWYSQVDAKTYYFCQNELTEYEVVK